MTRTHAVNSSFVRSVEYNHETKEATVHLASGSYHFPNVPESSVNALISAPSVGTHFNKVFKTKHIGKRI